MSNLEEEADPNHGLRSYEDLEKNFDEMLEHWFGDEPWPELQAGQPEIERRGKGMTVPLWVRRHQPSPPKSSDRASYSRTSS